MNTRFLIKTFLSNTQSASFQHGIVYGENATKKEKQAFQDDFHRRLWELAYLYSQPVSEEDHIRTIQDFSDQLSQAHPNALADERLNIGRAQKAVNLFLKFLWSIDIIPEPPHCPIDRTVIEKIGNAQNWTELDNIEEYQAIVLTIQQHAEPRTPAQWESDLWNRNV